MKQLKRIVEKMSTENQEQNEEKTKSARLCDLFNQKPIMEIIMIALGSDDLDITEFAGSQKTAYQTIDNYMKNKRSIPWDLILLAAERSGKSIDWVIYGEDRVVYCSTGKAELNGSTASNQVAIANMGPGGNVSMSSTQAHRPEFERLLAILDHYGSPALFRKIEQMVLDMYGEEYPANIPNRK